MSTDPNTTPRNFALEAQVDAPGKESLRVPKEVEEKGALEGINALNAALEGQLPEYANLDEATVTIRARYVGERIPPRSTG